MHSLTCNQAFPAFNAYLEKLAGAIHPLLDAPPVDIAGVTSGSPIKRLNAAKTLMPLVKCGALGLKRSYFHARIRNDSLCTVL